MPTAAESWPALLLWEDDGADEEVELPELELEPEALVAGTGDETEAEDVVEDKDDGELEEDEVEGRGEKDSDTLGLATLQNC